MELLAKNGHLVATSVMGLQSEASETYLYKAAFVPRHHMSMN